MFGLSTLYFLLKITVVVVAAVVISAAYLISLILSVLTFLS